MKIELVQLENPDGLNVIIGQAHFIKTVEDIHEMVVSNVPTAKFGLAFCEASGPRLIRVTGTDGLLTELARTNAEKIGCGHLFVLFMEDMFPINILPALKQIPEVVRLFCATANPVQVVVARTNQGGGVLGVIDGGSPKGVESEKDVKERKEILRKFGYKL